MPRIQWRTNREMTQHDKDDTTFFARARKVQQPKVSDSQPAKQGNGFGGSGCRVLVALGAAL